MSRALSIALLLAVACIWLDLNVHVVWWAKYTWTVPAFIVAVALVLREMERGRREREPAERNDD